VSILEARKVELHQRRDALLPELARLGLCLPVKPAGAFYIYADISGFADNAETFAAHLLETSGVAITPGRDFGRHRADHHVRFAYTTSLARIREATQRLATFLNSR
jgi:aspartate/methionine/tyrosine aminotransferase